MSIEKDKGFFTEFIRTPAEKKEIEKEQRIKELENRVNALELIVKKLMEVK